MNKISKVKKTISKVDNNKLVDWCKIIDLETWEIFEPQIKTSKYKLKLSNQKEFMKKWTDRKLNLSIKKWLSLMEKEILFDVLDYIDWDNIINFRLLALDYNYSPSKISKVKKLLKEKQLIKTVDWIDYLSPLIWIKTKDINQELIELFKNSFEKYWVEISFKK